MNSFFLYYLPFFSYFITVVTLTHVPGTRTICNADGIDKIFHFIAFAILAWLLHRILTHRIGHNISLLKPFFGLLIYAAIDEITQGLVTGRNSSFFDFFADALGIATISGVYFFIKRQKKNA